MPEQINLSDALDLIAQSKADIKTSITNKGGTVGDDLTQYATSINNIKLVPLLINGTGENDNTISLDVYDNPTYTLIVKTVNANDPYPRFATESKTGTAISYRSDVSIFPYSNNNPRKYYITAVEAGTTVFTIHDDVMNCDYNFTFNVTDSTPQTAHFVNSGTEDDPIDAYVVVDEDGNYVESDEFYVSVEALDANGQPAGFSVDTMDSWDNAEAGYTANEGDGNVVGDFPSSLRLGNDAWGWTGPKTAGTYLRSFTISFHYNINDHGLIDEATGDQVDNPVAQALDGTSITFWVNCEVRVQQN